MNGIGASVDRFLYAWFALESLLLTLYEHAADVGLPISSPDSSCTKQRRRQLQDERIRAILAAGLENDPTLAVMTAYFEGVVPIRRRSEAVLRAALGDAHPSVAWAYGAKDGPGRLRTELVHMGRSSQELHDMMPVPAIVARLKAIALRRWLRSFSWQMPFSTRSPLRRKWTAL